MNLLKKIKKFLVKDSKTSDVFAHLNQRLENRRVELASEFSERNKEVSAWLAEKGIDAEEVVSKGTRGVLAGVAAGMMMLSIGLAKTAQNLPVPVRDVEANKIVSEIKSRQVVDQELLAKLAGQVPPNFGPIAKENEDKITQTISEVTKVKVVGELEGNRLNTNFGLIGLEQHLPRYPGETIDAHFGSNAAVVNYGKTGMTKNRGAFGYFAPNKFALTTRAVEEEKYYVVVQTFDTPGWGKNKVDWYRHRKVLVINPANGKAVVGDIADSGPAKSTKKSFGGSPELMDNLGFYGGKNKGAVLLFFIDDSAGVVKLGPI